MQLQKAIAMANLPMSDDDDAVLDHEFYVETHVADAMPESHWHDHIEFNYLWSGQLTYLINGRRFTLGAGEMCLFWAATPHQVVSVEDNHRLSCAYMTLPVFLDLPLAPTFRKGVLQGDVYYCPAIDEGDRYMFARWTRDWAEADTIKRTILEDEVRLRVRRLSWSPHARCASGSADRTASSGTAQRSITRVEQMLALIHDHFDQSLKISDVVAASGLHPSNANAAFRKVLGITIGEYMRRHRLRHAMRLLVESDLDIAEVAYECGYASTTRLYDAFQKRLGKTPRRYRLEFRHRADPEQRVG